MAFLRPGSLLRGRLLACAIAVWSMPLAAARVCAQQSPAPDFVPDFTFTGSHLDGWHAAGSAVWEADQGVISVEAAPDSGGGVLLLDDTFENLAVYSRFRCSQECDAGLLIRVAEAAGGLAGILIAMQGDEVAPFRVRLDNNGRVVFRELALERPQGSQESGQGTALSGVLATANAALSAPVRIRPGDWNSIEIFADANTVSSHVNGVRNALPRAAAVNSVPPAPLSTGPVVPTDTARFGYGRVGIYIRSGRAEFSDFSVKNLLGHRVQPEYLSDRFRLQRLDEFTYAWGADVADIDRDGVLDVVSGPFYYLGPDFLARREFYPARVFNPGEEYVNDMLTFAYDWTGDGWVDILRTERRPLVLLVNPQGAKRYWDQVDALPEVCSETAVSADIDGDGQPEIIYVGADGRMAYGEPDPANPRGPWRVHKVSEPVVSGCNAHGVGAGDVNGDGRVDILQARGWWEQPAAGPRDGLWIYHDDWFGRLTRPPQHPGGAEIAVNDFNGDGLNDVVTSLSAHGWGLAWYEQQRAGDGSISFVEHVIMSDFSSANAGGVTFSQLHSGATLADIDRDGLVDFVTGKRHWSHLDSYADPDPNGEAVIYWYRTVRNAGAPGGVEFMPELIHNKSGVGSEVKVVDLNADGELDIVTAGTRGTFVFWGRPGGS